MKVIVCGGRDYADRKTLRKSLAAFHAQRPITAIIHGGARGADFLAEEWARHNRLPVIRVDAPWAAFGKAAGHTRNGWMLEHCQPNAVLAFPGGRGTEDMVRQAEAANVEVVRLPLDAESEHP